MSGTPSDADEDAVPVSVRLGEVVPPEDPEDWTRPLTWVAAVGMLAGPVLAFAWFVIAPPMQSERALPLTFGVAFALAGGAAATGATQKGIPRASTATLGAGLFGALVVIIAGVVMAGERQVAEASPTLAHAFGAAASGAAGAAGAALVAAVIANFYPGMARFLMALVPGVIVAFATLSALMPGGPKL